MQVEVFIKHVISGCVLHDELAYRPSLSLHRTHRSTPSRSSITTKKLGHLSLYKAPQQTRSARTVSSTSSPPPSSPTDILIPTDAIPQSLLVSRQEANHHRQSPSPRPNKVDKDIKVSDKELRPPPPASTCVDTAKCFKGTSGYNSQHVRTCGRYVGSIFISLGNSHFL